MTLARMLGKGYQRGGSTGVDLTTDGFNGQHVLIAPADALMSHYKEKLEADPVVSRWLASEDLARVEMFEFLPEWDFGDFPMIAIYPQTITDQQQTVSSVIKSTYNIYFGLRYELYGEAPRAAWEPGWASVLAQVQRAVEQETTCVQTIEGQQVVLATKSRNGGVQFFDNVDPSNNERVIATLEFAREVSVTVNPVTGLADEFTNTLGFGAPT